MANLTRAEEFQGVVRLLRRPKPQRPGPDLITSALIRQEQSMLNDQNLSGKGWTEEQTSFVTVSGTAEYALTPASTAREFGRALFVYRDLGNNDILPVPYTDYTQEIGNQKYDFWVTPLGNATSPSLVGDKVAFFRDNGGVKVRVFPIPTDAKTYYVKYAVGRLDWTQFLWTDVPYLPEWSYLRQLKASAFLLPDSEWEGKTEDWNMGRRRELEAAFRAEIVEEIPKYNAFLRNPQIEPISDLGYWWE